MDAEQLRDSILSVAGNLDKSQGGPSQDLTPSFLRRTVYGKVSRYKLDEYLQLFDFPSPSISAEKRFTTTVPLQRLFLMNSDFVQVEAEELAKRVAGEPDNKARIRKIYLLCYGREPKEQEFALGLEYLHSEPLREYEENKNKPKENGPGGRRRGGGGPKGPEGNTVSGGPGGKPGAPPVETPPIKGGTAVAAAIMTDAAKPAPEGAAIAEAEVATAGATPADEAATPAEGAVGMGMMGGVGMMGPGGRRGPGRGGAPDVKYEPTAWGRYAKILLSSSEFMFIN